MERWVEHYLELYSTENTVSEEVLNSIQLMPTMVEHDSEPTASQTEEAINGLANGKSPGNDTTPPRVIKQGIPVLLPHLCQTKVTWSAFFCLPQSHYMEFFATCTKTSTEI